MLELTLVPLYTDMEKHRETLKINEDGIIVEFRDSRGEVKSHDFSSPEKLIGYVARAIPTQDNKGSSPIPSSFSIQPKIGYSPITLSHTGTHDWFEIIDEIKVV